MTLPDAEEIVAIDTEFVAPEGERPKPICYVAKELKSGRVFREWVETGWPAVPPFAQGPRTITVAFYNSAEWGCYKAQGWSLPELTLDLYAEFRVLTNGLEVPGGSGLLGACLWHGLDAIGQGEKESARGRILKGGPYSGEDRKAILAYCESDVDALVNLLPRMIPDNQDVVPAIWRAEYMKAMAAAEWNGIPLDGALYRRMTAHWSELQMRAIDRVNQVIPVYEGRSFREKQFEAWLEREGLLDFWPRTDDGTLSLSDDTFRQEAAVHPALEPLRQTRQMLGQLHRPGVSVGSDSHNRCLLSAYGTVTGRNKPSTSKFIFGNPSWMRGLITPESGTALASIDWRAQEFGLAAALSGDANMLRAYQTGDCYLEFARMAHAVPEGATAETHPRERACYKTAALGTQYGIGAESLAYQLEISVNEAGDLLRQHRRLFPRYWQWIENVTDYAQLYGGLTAAYGWKMQLGPRTRMRTLKNWPMQSNGSEMLRAAAVFTMEAGIQFLAPIHDVLRRPPKSTPRFLPPRRR
jgi:DNA polymerase I